VSSEDEGVNPENPRCPICGAIDWWSDPRIQYGVPVFFKPDRKPMNSVIPLDVAICRVCRFVRFTSAEGDLEIAFPPE
jgi:hypothetical protein